MNVAAALVAMRALALPEADIDLDVIVFVVQGETPRRVTDATFPWVSNPTGPSVGVSIIAFDPARSTAETRNVARAVPTGLGAPSHERVDVGRNGATTFDAPNTRLLAFAGNDGCALSTGIDPGIAPTDLRGAAIGGATVAAGGAARAISSADAAFLLLAFAVQATRVDKTFSRRHEGWPSHGLLRRPCRCRHSTARGLGSRSDGSRRAGMAAPTCLTREGARAMRAGDERADQARALA
jgi:hypothetical protein